MPEPKVEHPLPIDEFHGMGGSYTIKNGKRTQVEAPTAAADAEPAPAVEASDEDTNQE